jgi:hypothetical protein
MAMADEGTVSYDEIRRRSTPRVAAVLGAFDFGHLPPELQAISKPFCDLAHQHAGVLGAALEGSARAVHLEQGLLRLLEAKDAIVRAYITDSGVSRS